MAAIRPPYTSTFNHYVRTELGYKSDLEYYILGGGFTSPWNWNTNNGYVDTSVALRNALAKNPYLRVFVAMGYYDMATPYFAVQHTLHHISLDPLLLKLTVSGVFPTVGFAPRPEVVSDSPHLVDTYRSFSGRSSRRSSLAHCRYSLACAEARRIVS